MVFFSKIHRSKSDAHYPSHPDHGAVYGPSNPAHRPSHHRQGSGQRSDYGPPPKVSFESIPQLVYENGYAAGSDTSLPAAYTNVEIDTSRYPKMPAYASSASQAPVTHGRRSETHDGVEHYESNYESHLAPMLAVGSSPVMWDVRGSPAHMRQARHSRQADDLTVPATSTHSPHIRLISQDFPWTIEVSKKGGRPLTVLDIIEALYEGLSKELRRSEWALAADGQKYAIQKANKTRRHSETPKRLRRIDWLGSRCMFRGLEKDDGLARRRSMPGDESQGEIWAVRFGSQR